MTERATFCPRCGHMHTGVCPLAKKTEPRQATDRGSSSGRTSGFGPEDEGSMPSPRTKPERLEVAKEALAKFDKGAYQREYMRQKRGIR